MKSFYGILCELAQQHSLFSTGGCCDQLKFDLIEKKIYTAGTVLMDNGKIIVSNIRLRNGTEYQTEDITLMTAEELGCDTEEMLNILYSVYKTSVPSERSQYTKGLFKAKQTDELSDAELVRNQDRILSRYKLEAYILLAALLGEIQWPVKQHWFRRMEDPDFVLLRDWIESREDKEN